MRYTQTFSRNPISQPSSMSRRIRVVWCGAMSWLVAVLAVPAADLADPPHGLVVEEVFWSGERVGIQAEDVLHYWAPADEDGQPLVDQASSFSTPFDWLVYERECADPRTDTVVMGERNGELLVVKGPRHTSGRSAIAARPLLPPRDAQRLLEARSLAGGGDVEAAAAALRTLGHEHQNPRMRLWLALEAAKTLAMSKPQEALTAIQQVLDQDGLALRERAFATEVAAEIHLENEELKAAGSSYRRAAELAKSAKAPLLAAWYLFRLYQSDLVDQGQFESVLREMCELAESSAPHSWYMALGFNDRGSLSNYKGDLEAAEDHYQRALGAWPGWAISSANLIQLYVLRGEHERAEQVARRSLETGDNYPTLIELANMFGKRGKYSEARALLDRASNLTAWGRPGRLVRARALLAEAEEDWDKAYELHEQELKERRGRDAGNLAWTLYSLADIDRRRGRYALASERLGRALEVSYSQVTSSALRPLIHQALGRVKLATFRFAEAVEAYREAIADWERMLSRMGGNPLNQTRSRARDFQVHGELEDLLLRLDRPAEAFAVAERARGRVFLEMVAQRDIGLGAGVLEAEEESLRALSRESDAAYASLVEADDPEQRLLAQAELQRLDAERYRVIADLRRANPRAAVLKHPQPLDLEGIRATLDPGTLLLLFSTGPDATRLYAVSPETDLQVEILPLTEEDLRRRIETFRRVLAETAVGEALRDMRARDAERLAADLYGSLLAPIAQAIEQSERLVIVPSGPLHSLPFAALRRPEAAGGQYLVEWKPLHFAISATLYDILRQLPAERETEDLVVALGDPQFSGVETKDADSIEDLRLRSVARAGFEFEPLPESRSEVEAIAAVYEPEATVRVLLGDEATEVNAKAFSSNARVLHFATHGYVDHRYPLNSGLVLTLSVANGDDQNGLLQAWEVFEQLRLTADLVVLSACESGRGTELTGEGLVGLTQAFLYAGARTVAASLWRVEDASSAELMVRFHRHFAAGKAKDEALRAAQLELLRGDLDRDYSSPYFWAGFQIYGDWRAAGVNALAP